jgi:hypothetical protein
MKLPYSIDERLLSDVVNTTGEKQEITKEKKGYFRR